MDKRAFAAALPLVRLNGFTSSSRKAITDHGFIAGFAARQ